MKATELRIGNLVLKNGKEYLISSKFFVDVFDGTCYEHEYKPIPLTEEWLLKFGFRWSIPHQAHYKNGFKYVIDFHPSHPQFSKQVCFVNYKHRTGDNLICVQYVHQLQNLYFSLTNEELTIKS